MDDADRADRRADRRIAADGRTGGRGADERTVAGRRTGGGRADGVTWGKGEADGRTGGGWVDGRTARRLEVDGRMRADGARTGRTSDRADGWTGRRV